MKYKGYSNGKEYEVFEIDPLHPNCGLVQLPEYRIKTWCLFEKIMKANAKTHESLP
jgi:hypothetical protein